MPHNFDPAMVGINSPLSREEQFHYLTEHCLFSRESSLKMLHTLWEERNHYYDGLQECQQAIAKQHALLEELTAQPWHPAFYLGAEVADEANDLVLHRVQHSARTLLVQYAGECPLEEANLQPGCEVYLAQNLNAILGRAPLNGRPVGELASFDRLLEDGRVVLRTQGDTTVVALATAGLQTEHLKPGDLCRWHREAMIVFESFPNPAGQQYLFTQVPDIGLAQLGGQEANAMLVLDALGLALTDPTIARSYGMDQEKHGFVLVGVPGVGKTLLLKSCASELQRRFGTKVKLAVVRPAEWLNPYWGVSEANVRSTFAAAQEAAEEGICILFLDELESISRTRGSMTGQHGDRLLAALLAEIDGVADRGNIAIVGATNRLDLVDPALVERIGEHTIRIGRPTAEQARAILGIHLAPQYRYAANGKPAEAMREEIIDTAVSLLYAPNAAPLCELKFRDGRTRKIYPREQLSGRLLSQVAKDARRRANLRHLQHGDAGIRVSDITHAVEKNIERLRWLLTPANAHSCLDDLPTDIDVIAVTPYTRTEQTVSMPQAMQYIA